LKIEKKLRDMEDKRLSEIEGKFRFLSFSYKIVNV